MVAMLLKDTRCYGDEWEEGCFNSDQFRKSRPSKRDAIEADALRMTKQENTLLPVSGTNPSSDFHIQNIYFLRS